MDYHPDKGHRVKGRVNWVHKRLKSVEDGCLQQCLFGLHLVNRKENVGKPICIVESEKTAVFMSMLIKQGVWLATGGKQRLKKEELGQLSDRKVVLFPDKGCEKDWEDSSRVVSNLITVSRVLESTNKINLSGIDIVDYLLL
jgi:hypothetical protein